MKFSSGFIGIANTFFNMLKGKGQNTFDTLQNPTSSRLSYSENGRSGYIFYTEKGIQISFYYELGGGDCQLCINIPAETQWEKETNTPLSRRNEIVNYIGKNVIKDKYSLGRRYEIEGNWINVY